MATAGALRQLGVSVPVCIPSEREVVIGLPMNDDDVSRVVHRVIDLLPVLDRLPQISCEIAGVMRMLGCRSRSAAYRELDNLGVAAYIRGKYRIRDIENAVARRSYAAQAKRRAQRLLE